MSTNSTAEALLSAQKVRRAFRVGDRSLEVLHGVDLDLFRGERLCLMGSSGAGKTTFLNILGLLDKPTEGEIFIEGQRAWGLAPKARAQLRNQKIGFVFQFYHLLPELDAIENTVLPAMIANGAAGYRSKVAEVRDRATEMLVHFGLENRLKHRPGKLSGGEQQRVAIARSLILDPPLMIADEPTGNLDRRTGEKVLELIFEQQELRDLTLLLVTHDERLAKRCGRVVYMEDGLIQADTATPIPT